MALTLCVCVALRALLVCSWAVRACPLRAFFGGCGGERGYFWRGLFQAFRQVVPGLGLVVLPGRVECAVHDIHYPSHRQGAAVQCSHLALGVCVYLYLVCSEA